MLLLLHLQVNRGISYINHVELEKKCLTCCNSSYLKRVTCISGSSSSVTVITCSNAKRFSCVCVCVCVCVGGGVGEKEIHSECRSVPTREQKLHWSKPFLVLHPLKSSLKKQKKQTQDKPKYSLQRKIENSSFLWHENISGVYIWSQTVSIHLRQSGPCS